MRSILALCLFAACSNPSKADPAPTPARNLVCERIAKLDPKAKCEPEYTDAGEGHVHTARVTQDKSTVACGLSAGQLGMVCGPLVAEAKQDSSPAPGTEPAKPAATKPAKK